MTSQAITLHGDEGDLSFSGWENVFEVADVAGGSAQIGVRFARDGDLVDAYPAGAHDREIAVRGLPSHDVIRASTDAILAADPRCRRIILAVPDEDLDSIGWAEDSGFRFVVSVETRRSAVALLVVEPTWVLDQPQALNEIPLKE